MEINKIQTGANSRYESFNGLRAIAALGIAMMHYRAFIVVKPSVNFITGNVIPFFTEFVFLFFMVSAFGMCCGYFMMFRLVEKIHLERHIGDNDWLFVATYVVGISLTIAFAWTVKYKVFPMVGECFAKVTKY